MRVCLERSACESLQPTMLGWAASVSKVGVVMVMLFETAG